MQYFGGEPPVSEDITIEKAQEALLGVIKELRKKATDEKTHPTKQFDKYEKYYSGGFDDKDKLSNRENNRNIIKPIVETKTTYILDAKISTSVEPRSLDFADLDNLKAYQDISDILNSALESVFDYNDIQAINQRVCRRGNKLGIGIGKAVWDPDLSRGLGDIKISEINPSNFFPDPSASSIRDCNYIFERSFVSPMSLKRMYPEHSKDIDGLSSAKGVESKSSNSDRKDSEISGVESYYNSGDTNQAYLYSSQKAIRGASDNLEVWEFYFKDDTPFIPTEGDSDEAISAKEGVSMLYPNGRVIIFCGGIILDDKAIDSKFGYPYCLYNDLETDKIWGSGEIEDLVSVQDRVNRAYTKLLYLNQVYVSTILLDPNSGIDKDSFVNAAVLQVDPGTLQNSMPQILTNNTLSEIQHVQSYIEMLKQDAKEMAGMNDMMLSGQRPDGVNSGQMVSILNESPLTRIRSSQRNFAQYMVELSNMCITLIQQYYNTPRLIHLSQGNKIAVIPNREDGKQFIEIREKTQDEELQEYTRVINGDLSLGEYEVKVSSGTELPKSKQAIANITMQLVQQGYFGPVGDPNTLDLVLEKLDYPGRRAIVNKVKADQEKRSQEPILPQTDDLMKSVKIGFNEMPIESQMEYLKLLGLVPNNVDAGSYISQLQHLQISNIK